MNAFDGAGKPYKGPQSRDVIVLFVVGLLVVTFFMVGGPVLVLEMLGVTATPEP